MHRIQDIQMWLLLQGSSGSPCCFSKLSLAGCIGIARMFAYEMELCFCFVVGAGSWMEMSCQAGSLVHFGVTGTVAVLEHCLRFALIIFVRLCIKVYKARLHCG